MQFRETMLADVLNNNYETVNLLAFVFLTLSNNLNAKVKPQGQYKCQMHCHPCFTDSELKHKQVK